MDAKLLAKVALRVMGLYFILEGTSNLPLLANAGSLMGDEVQINSGVIWMVATVIAPIVLGLIVWFAAQPLAARVVGAQDGQESAGKPDPFNLQVLAFTMIGVFIIINDLPRISGILYVAVSNPTAFAGAPSFIEGLVMSSIKVVLGFALIAGAGFFTELFRRFREFGMKADI